ncbi:hypothetical protein Tco_0625029 [Tanacetum coccineum]|uniref:Uncharacterized protein n=1 Tax=Tanacetum coccineum TaxID=301880 RepID=A0ABQ4WFN1_9ASTR
MFLHHPSGFWSYLQGRRTCLTVLRELLVIFKRLTTVVDLCHVVSKDKFFDFTSFVASVEPLNSEQRNFKQQILKLDDFLKLTIIHFFVRARRTNAAVLSCATFIAAVHDIPHTVDYARVIDIGVHDAIANRNNSLVVLTSGSLVIVYVLDGSMTERYD